MGIATHPKIPSIDINTYSQHTYTRKRRRKENARTHWGTIFSDDRKATMVGSCPRRDVYLSFSVVPVRRPLCDED